MSGLQDARQHHDQDHDDEHDDQEFHGGDTTHPEQGETMTDLGNAIYDTLKMGDPYVKAHTNAILALPEMAALQRDAAAGRWLRENSNEWDRLNNAHVAGAMYVWERASTPDEVDFYERAPERQWQEDDVAPSYEDGDTLTPDEVNEVQP